LGCATTSDVASVKGETNELKKSAFEIQKDISDVRTELADLKEKTTGVVREDALNAVRESTVSLRSDISGISKDIQTLIGRFDENKYFLDKTLSERSSEMGVLRTQIAALDAQVKDLQIKLSSVKTDIEKVKVTQDAPQKEAKTDHVETRTPEVKDPANPAKIYEVAYNTFKEKKYKEAREKFEAFLKEFPQDKLAGNAQFWIGETYYAEEDYAGAIVEYDALLKNYPESEKSPAALLKQGYSFVEMGDKKAAKGILGQLREKYPKSKEAELAKKKIEEISKKSR
jgi:tol-pal system protein YbgF